MRILQGQVSDGDHVMISVNGQSLGFHVKGAAVPS
jgi:hypothetical protein